MATRRRSREAIHYRQPPHPPHHHVAPRRAEAQRDPGDEYELWLCDDCTIAEANGDYSGMSVERAEEVAAGIERLVAEVGPLSANWTEDEGTIDFTSRPCDACGTRLAGSRTRWAAFGRSGLAREGDDDDVEDAEAAGAQYAREQIESQHFNQWVWEQIVEGEEMRRRGENIIEDPSEVARNILQQLRWDIMRDAPIPRGYGAEASRAWGRGLRDELERREVRDWLTEEIAQMTAELRGTPEPEPVDPRQLPLPGVEAVREGIDPIEFWREQFLKLDTVMPKFSGKTVRDWNKVMNHYRAAGLSGMAAGSAAQCYADYRTGAKSLDQAARECAAEIPNAERILGRPMRPGRTEEYIAVDRHDRVIGGPFASYDDAKREADRTGGVVQYVSPRWKRR